MSKTIPFINVARALGELNIGTKLNGNVVVDQDSKVIGVLIGDHLAEKDLSDYVMSAACHPDASVRRQNRLAFWNYLLDEKQLTVHGGRYDGAKVKPFYGDYWLVRVGNEIELFDDMNIETLELSADYMSIS